MRTQPDMDQLAINTIRMLVVDAVQKAKSGHPGTPMDAAPTAYTLWQRILRYDPTDPAWPNRDRFVLSAGHASMLLYSMLHLAGVKSVNPQYEILGEPSVTLDDIRHFRQSLLGPPPFTISASSAGIGDRVSAFTLIPSLFCRTMQLSFSHSGS